ncbi:pilus assembly protein TadG-related protein [Streptomyces sp. RerS4]|uniref:pilus assembly protein TadG-related protein n=1 Tax=Streptomyces sp. RerS4 TaxID=2942449 RepID=UPI00201C1750|nr:pilus assembly protein TadG-related protein [Streptomyces sp. RerS4]UQX02743.1 pilus assembly protein TadG-related protein [Streptomyces sp. RerS4]
MGARFTSDSSRGQAFPIYVVVVAGLLFAALALFVVGQASVTRSDAQGAADAAALAAAKDVRDHLAPGVNLVDLEPEGWGEILKGNLFAPGRGCAQADVFAGKNGAKASCTVAGLSVTVAVETERTVGDSVLPGTDGMHGTASATAVIEPRCHLGALPPGGGTPTPTPVGTAPPTDGPTPKPATVTIECKGGKGITFDPSKPEPWRTVARALFDVRLDK